ncbi:MAG: FixH family protein [Fimbriimonadaceae bacterium]
MNTSQTLRLLMLSLTGLALAGAYGDAVNFAAVSVNPNPPVVGRNVLVLTLTDATGQPLNGVRLTTTVAMTTMDMGTTHPAVKVLGKGNYQTTVAFVMAGPWRVTLTGSGPGGNFKRSFDFQPGSKKRWVMSTQKAQHGRNPAKPSPTPINVLPIPVPPAPSTSPIVPATPLISPPQTQTPKSMSMSMAMTHDAAGMPQLKEKMVVKAAPGLEFATNAGFGRNSPMVAMMNRMMIGGSGIERMMMAPMVLTFDEANFSGDAADVRETSDSANYGSLLVTAKLVSASVGDNNIAITVATKGGKPVGDASVSASVAMKTMDMGTTHPIVMNVGRGKYTVRANFGMTGPWRLTLTVAVPGDKPAVYHFDFQAK